MGTVGETLTSEAMFTYDEGRESRQSRDVDTKGGKQQWRDEVYDDCNGWGVC